MSFRNGVKVVLLATLVALAIMQFPKVQRTNPRATGEVQAPPAIEATLRRACYDCHSNETRWPWYSRVAPLSWLIARDVALGREELNFSEWRSYYPQTRQRKLQWMGRVLRERAMPPWSYRLMHPGTQLTGAERAMLERWVESGISTPVPRATSNHRHQMKYFK